MAVNKVVYGTTVLVDLTNDTVAENNMLEGTTAHNAAGEVVTGNVVTQIYRTGTGAPSNTLGNNGDLYFNLG